MPTTAKIKLTRDIDPTTFSVVWNKFDYIVEQIGQKILYSTQSFVTALVRDLGQTLLDSNGRIVSAATFLPAHTMVAEEAIKGLESYFHGEYEPGDFIVANDPYIVKGGHLPDWNFVRPAFYKGERIGFLQAKTHVSDTGGFLPGGYGPGAYDIIAEGLNIPPLKVIKGGVLQKEVWGFLLKNVRNHNQVDMDTMLINGCLEQGEQQLVALCDKYGVETVKTCMEEIIDAGERAMRAEIEKIPDGTYYGESATDWDGRTDKPIWVRAKVTIKGDEAIVDLSESDDQATFVNLPMGQTQCTVMCAFYYLIDASVPKTGGTMRLVHIVLRPGSVVDPVYPATVGASQISVAHQVLDAVMSAVGKAIPERAMAGWTRHMCPINIGMDPRVIDPRTGHIKQYFAETFASDAGSGAVKGYDGWQGIAMQATAGNFMRPNIEHFELSVPYLCTRYEILKDWEGAGEFRGSPGTYTEMYADTPKGAPAYLMTGNSDGEFYPPFGVEGGRRAPGAEMWIVAKGGKRRRLRTMANDPIYPGEKYFTMCPGGGGYGNPLKRDVKRVQEDVMDGLVSIKRARDVYGVILDPRTLEIDGDATKRLRAEKRGKKQEKKKGKGKNKR
jgi:N-methylhydantoinase B